MLEVKDLHAYYGKSHILHGVHLSVREGEIVSLLGRNGVGRSTTIKAIMGMVQCEGSVKFRGEELRGEKTYAIAHKGLGYVPENRDIFPTLTVRQNLVLGQKAAKPAGRWKAEDMYELFPRLKERVDTQAGVLSGGEQQMLTLCRTLMGDPGLNDEPPIPFRYGDYRAIRRPYLPADYLRDAAGFQIEKSVYVETEWDPADPVGEMRYVEGLRREHGLPTVAVAQAWLHHEN